MTPESLGAEVTRILAGTDSLRQVQILRKTIPADQIGWFDALIDVGLSSASPSQVATPAGSNHLGVASAVTQPTNGSNTVVILLHGMLTEAVWQNQVASEIRRASAATVYSIGYGWFDVIRFWFPFGTRARPLATVLRELRDVQRRHPDCELVVIAHSFSTHLVSQILMEHKDVQITRLLLCGSIIPIDYRWDQAASAALNIVNEVGTKDFWPVIARVTSWGYGCSGTMGFKTNRVSDRYFDYDHSGFFAKEHVEQFWLPFVLSGAVLASPWSDIRPTPSLLLSVCGALPQIKLVLIALLLGVAYLVVSLPKYLVQLFL